MVTRKGLAVLLGLLLLLGLGLAACGGGDGSSSQPTESSSAETTTEATEAESEPVSAETEQLAVGELNFDMKKYCGEKPTRVGLLDGFGGITWRVQVRALNEKTLHECPNVTEIKYYDANGDQEKYNSTLSAWAAEGVNLVEAFPDFGAASLPAFRAAQKKGVIIVTDNSLPEGAKIPEDLTAAAIPDYEAGAREWVEFLDEATKGTAHIVMIGGPPGAAVDLIYLKEMQKAIEETGADVEFLDDEPIPGYWEAAKTQQATSAVISKYPNLNGIVSTYTALIPAMTRAFDAANKKLPTIVGQGISNEVTCNLIKIREGEDPNFNMMSLDSTGNLPPLALAEGMAAYQEIEAPELGPTDAPTVTNLSTYIDTLKGDIPKCYPSVPPGADLSMALTPEEVEKLGG